MIQSALTVVSPVMPTRLEALEKLLVEIGDSVESYPGLPLTSLSGLHFCSWSLCGGTDAQRLIFEANFDGSEAGFLDQLTQSGTAVLSRIYSHCTGMSDRSDTAQIRDHLRRHKRFTHTFYIGLRGYTVQRIVQEERLRVAIEDFIDAQQSAGHWTGCGAKQIQQAIREHVSSLTDFKWAAQSVPDPWLVRNGRRLLLALQVAALFAGAALVALAFISPVVRWLCADLLIVAALCAAVFAWRLRWLERADPVADPNLKPPVDDSIFHRENRIVQNHL